jgi:hypothetical protein
MKNLQTIIVTPWGDAEVVLVPRGKTEEQNLEINASAEELFLKDMKDLTKYRKLKKSSLQTKLMWVFKGELNE